MAQNLPNYEELKHEVWHYDRWDDEGIWPHLKSTFIEESLRNKNQIKYTRCGNADIMCFSARNFIDTCNEIMNELNEEHFTFGDQLVAWINKINI